MKKQFGKIGLIILFCFGCLSCKQASIENTSQNSNLTVQADEEVLPDMDEFVAFEKEPKINVEELATNIIYPEEAKLAGLEGKVNISVYIDKFGKAKKVVVRESTSPVFINSAIDAVNKTSYSPAENNGKPCGCWIVFPIVFKLK